MQRTRTVASAITVAFCASVVATGVIATAVSFDAAHAADECLSAPKGAAPAGAHWYYRSDRKTNRKCWYVADEAPKPRQAASQQPATPHPQQPDTKLEASTADAHAELPAETAPAEQPAETAAVKHPAERSPVAEAQPVQSVTVQPGAAQPVAVAPDQVSRDTVAAALRAAAQSGVAPVSNVEVADDSVNVDQPDADPQTKPAASATVGQAQAAPSPAATEPTVGPLRAAFGWILIGLGCMTLLGGMFFGFPSGRRPQARQRFAETMSR